MSSTKFKLSVVTTALLSAFAAKATAQPMYSIVPVNLSADVQNSFTPNEVHGVAIRPATEVEMAELGPLGCFSQHDESLVNCEDGFQLAGEARLRVDSVSLLDEAPFAMDASFGYIEDYDSFKSYCYRELLYSTCESWASTYWNSWRNTVNGVENIKAFVQGSAENTTSYIDYRITSIDESGEPIGMQSTTAAENVYTPRRNIISVPELPVDDLDSVIDHRAWAKLVASDGTVYVTGSTSKAKRNDNGDYYSSRATIWTAADENSTFSAQQLGWPSGKEQDGQRIAQASVRDIAELSDGSIYAVGYNTFDGSNNYFQASVFKRNEDGSFSQGTEVSGATSKNNDGDVIYSNTQLVSINNNGIAIGESKLYGSRPENGAAANKPFVVEDIASARSAKYLQNYGQSLFFTGVGADLGAINNFNEIVGAIDATQARENDGQPRRRRGFIYTVPNLDTSMRADLFRNKAWLLDDLTNDGNQNSHNNKYRIIAASDINDAGVISATAIYCSVGYDDTTHNSYCGNRQVQEQVVAVKLVPNPASLETEDGTPTINPRGVNDPPVERQGAGFGWLFLAALGFLGFRRK
ncbi:DUF3466 family protein [Vibrio agarivorans]|uniref:DUF3466 family protein n=1 Tax=Vibrio agarivorans TaxID=153622 RepID=A0ABT7XZD0_9VIBR|nr:DUF3466 family protein [Vibrio agarivorans]MDN2481131.1 DUF3466 family protein [Vibrio agarivorans]